MDKQTDQTTPTPATPTETAEPVTYHWIATVQCRGRIETNDGPVTGIPGVHTHTSTYRAVLANLTEKYGTDYGLLFFALAPDQL